MGILLYFSSQKNLETYENLKIMQQFEKSWGLRFVQQGDNKKYRGSSGSLYMFHNLEILRGV